MGVILGPNRAALRQSVSLDIWTERVSTEPLVVVKEFTLNRCPFPIGRTDDDS
jgi:hypothetical protein